MKCRKNMEYNSVFSLLTRKHNPKNIKAVTIRKKTHKYVKILFSICLIKGIIVVY